MSFGSRLPSSSGHPPFQSLFPSSTGSLGGVAGPLGGWGSSGISIWGNPVSQASAGSTSTSGAIEWGKGLATGFVSEAAGLEEGETTEALESEGISWGAGLSWGDARC